MSTWQWVLLDPGKAVLTQIGQFLVNILLVIVILIIGWILSKMVQAIITKVLRIAKLDELSDRIELDDVLAKGGIKYSLSELVGNIFYWLGLLVTLVIAVNAIGLTVAADLLNKVVLYVPNIIAAVFILILGMFIAKLLNNIVITAANNAGIAQANILGKVVEVITMVFVIAIALEQLNIGARIIELTVTIILASLGLGAALAFGLGCKDLAGKSVGEFIEKLKKK